MQMTEAEIKTAVMQAKNQLAQIEICAQLNAVETADIRRILKNQGVDLRTLKGSTDKRQSNGRVAEESSEPETDPVSEINRRISELVTVRNSADAELRQLRDKLSSLIEAIG